MNKIIQICMGSACHLKGAPLIAQAFQVELEKRQKSGDVLFELTGAFCQPFPNEMFVAMGYTDKDENKEESK